MKRADNTTPPPPPHIVGGEYDGQRLDNYLLREWRGAPRSLVYRLIRAGQVRVNAARAKPRQRLQAGDKLRLPPRPPAAPARNRAAAPLELAVLFEDDGLIAVNKPAGLAVHGGSGAAHGVIERLRAAGNARFLELAHRLDKHTSGVLLLAKKRAHLRIVQEQWRQRRVKKLYTALVFGEWRDDCRRITLPLKRITAADGNRRVRAADDGKNAETRTRLIRQRRHTALLSADIATGRTHQLRVHLADVGLPIVGDDKYGDFAANRKARAAGAPARMYLHAARLEFAHPASGDITRIEAKPPPAFAAAGEALDGGGGA